MGPRRLLEPRGADSADQERPAARGPAERDGARRHCRRCTASACRTVRTCSRTRRVASAGEPVQDVKNAFHTALETAEIKDFTWHDLRHTFASWLIMKGASLGPSPSCWATRPADGDAVRAPVAGLSVGGSGPARMRRCHRLRHGRRSGKGKKRATCREARSAAGESRRICQGKWLLRLDSNQQPSG